MPDAKPLLSFCARFTFSDGPRERERDRRADDLGARTCENDRGQTPLPITPVAQGNVDVSLADKVASTTERENRTVAQEQQPNQRPTEGSGYFCRDGTSPCPGISLEVISLRLSQRLGTGGSARGNTGELCFHCLWAEFYSGGHVV